MFREEVFKSKKNRLLGTVNLNQPISLYIVNLMIVSFFIVFVIYLTQCSYSRKESVKGYLTPKKGVVKVFSSRRGVIDSFLVTEGSHVAAGDNLVKVRNSHSLSTGLELSEALSFELEAQSRSLSVELDTISHIHNKEQAKIEEQLLFLDERLSIINETKSTYNSILILKENALLNNKNLFNNGYLSPNQLSKFEEEYLDAKENLNRTNKEISLIKSEIINLEYERLISPDKIKSSKVSINRQISSIKTQLFELKSQYEFLEKAPESGVVTAIQMHPGSSVSPGSSLLSIIPNDSPLEIEMFLPTRSAGFIQMGDKVNIRFDAFPYQKFGMVQGEVISVDKALLLPSEKKSPIKIDEPMYVVRASLSKQNISAYGKIFYFKVGMIADADIILEKRSLLEWLLEPVYAISGKFNE
ncbi:HlyD family secretion protein [Vibrio sp. OPT20]|uniref:HlyD family secretion protein n=1 Tax=Vibrio sp. OPT20 TaxID=2778642 RepID=UPI001D15828F|nr:HlyD family efflux transporter periplasmic adaptor subunit [Vibrio sp. OPT20]